MKHSRYFFGMGLAGLAGALSAGEPAASSAVRPDRQDQARPNVLFIIADDLGQQLGCYGNEMARTPNLDRLAEQGVMFRNSFTQFPTCGPSRTSMLSGMYPFQTGVTGNAAHFPAPDKRPRSWVSLPRLFRESGYTTVRAGKVFHMGIPRGIGQPGADDPDAWDEAIDNTGWDAVKENYEQTHRLPGKFNPGTSLAWLDPEIADEEMADGAGTREALRVMEESHPRKTGKPLMLFMGYYRPHPPMVSPRSHWQAIDPGSFRFPEVPDGDRDDIPEINFHLKNEAFNFIPEEAGRSYAHAYHAAVNFMDGEVGKLLVGLKKNGLAENTIIVFTGDQGFHLGEHGHWHKSTFFEQACRVPLIVLDPRSKPDGHVAEGLCGLIDVYPTLCELAGVKSRHRLSGRSLVPLMQDPSGAGKKAELTQGNPGGASVRTKRFRYTEWKREPGKAMLYDLEKDPGEFTNLSGQEEWKEKEREMKKLLHSMMGGSGNGADR